MGLSIYYSGRIKEYSMIPALVTEVKDVCDTYRWEYHLFDDQHLKGICFVPKNCEAIFLTFTKSGELRSPIAIKYGIEPSNVIFTKTQYAGMEVHKTVTNYFRHLQNKYFSQFELFDESYYWETGDENILRQRFNEYDSLVEGFGAMLDQLERADDETTDELAQRIQNRSGGNSEIVEPDS